MYAEIVGYCRVMMQCVNFCENHYSIWDKDEDLPGVSMEEAKKAETYLASMLKELSHTRPDLMKVGRKFHFERNDKSEQNQGITLASRDISQTRRQVLNPEDEPDEEDPTNDFPSALPQPKNNKKVSKK